MQKSKVTFFAVRLVGPGVIPPPLPPGALGFTYAISLILIRELRCRAGLESELGGAAMAILLI